MEELRRYNVRMPVNTSKVFDSYAEIFGYKRSTFIFVCALEGLISKVGRNAYFDMVRSFSGCLTSEPSVEADKDAR